MAGRLSGFTAVRDAHGVTHSFGPQDEIPAWARKKITNPKLWADGDAPAPDDDDPDADSGADDGGDGSGGASPAAGDGDPDAGSAGDGADTGAGKPAPVPPPKGGKGSGEERWREYADAVGVDVSEAQDRDDIITLLELAEVPTE